MVLLGTLVLFLRRLWNRLHLAMHSGAVCYTELCRLPSGAVCYTGACFYVAYMLYVHMEPCENRLIDP